MQQKDIAAAIGRNPSVVSREIARTGGRRAYRAHRNELSGQTDFPVIRHLRQGV